MSVGRVSRRLNSGERRLWVRGVVWANSPGCLEGLPLAFQLACSLSLVGWRVQFFEHVSPLDRHFSRPGVDSLGVAVRR